MGCWSSFEILYDRISKEPQDMPFYYFSGEDVVDLFAPEPAAKPERSGAADGSALLGAVREAISTYACTGVYEYVLMI